MPLIACPDCNRQVSTKAASCPGCGCPVNGTDWGFNAASVPLRNCPNCVQGRVENTCACCDGSGQEVCYFCDGRGTEDDGYRRVRCSQCLGNPRHPCECCAGRGFDLAKCDSCKGTGQLTQEEFDALGRQKAEEARKLELEKQRQVAERAQQQAEADRRKAEEHAQWLADEPKRKATEERKRAEEARKREEQQAQLLRQQKADRASAAVRGTGAALWMPFRLVGWFFMLLIAYPVPTIIGCVVVVAFVSNVINTSNGHETPSVASLTPTAADTSNGLSSGSPSIPWTGEHFPQTRLTYLTDADIVSWSYSGVRYAINEIYARHGYSFPTEGPIRRHFDRIGWYKPDEGLTADVAKSKFTSVERANELILARRRDALVRAGQAIK